MNQSSYQAFDVLKQSPGGTAEGVTCVLRQIRGQTME
jgi:hypothetical protein